MYHETIYRLAVEQVAGYAIFMLDPQGHTTSWNAGVRHLLGWDEAEWLGKPFSVIFSPQDVGKGYADRELQEASRRGGVENDRWNVKKDGTRFWASGITTALRDAQGRVTGFLVVMRDLTDRKQAEDALRASEDQLRLVTDALPVLISYVDREQRYRFNNAAYEHWFRHPRGSVRGKHLREVLGDEAYEVIRPHVEKALAGQEVHIEAHLPYRDAGTRDVAVHYVPHVADGVVQGFIALVADVSERKRAEARLAEEVRTIETINHVGRALVGERDLKTVVQTVVDAATQLTGAQFGAFFYNIVNEHGESYSLYSISGVPREAFARFPMPRNTQLFGPTFRGEGIIRSDDVTLDPRYGKSAPHFGMPQGHLPVHSYLAVPVMARSGEVLGGLFFGHEKIAVFDERDERIVVGIAAQAAVALDNARLLDALKVGRDRMEIVLKAADVGLWYCKLPFSDLVWDEKVKEHFFLPPNAAVTIQTFFNRLHPDDRARTQEAIERSIATGGLYDIDYRTVSPDGSVKWIRAAGRAFYDEAGKPVRFDGMTIDVTARKRAEEEREQLLASERAARGEAERASVMKDEFLAVVSHELRTPLNAILGWSQMLQRNRTEDVLAEGLAVIERNARLQTALISDLLDMSRIISGKVRLEVQRVDVAAVIESVIDSVRPSFEAKSIRLTRTLDPRAGAVRGDPARLQQVMWNLLSNAIKFTPNGGRIQVVLERVDAHVEITVSDNGVGIKPEFLPHVFDRFRQADASITRRYGGLGIGLSIVKHLVELHGGSVHAMSAGEGQGTTFRVALPTSSADEADLPHAASGAGEVMELPSLRGVRVLVVDDDPDARELVRRVLEEHDAQALTAASAGEALRSIGSEPPHVLISDIGMPIMDGYELIRRVRGFNGATGTLPAIALTAFARSEDRQRAMIAGYDMFVSKPVEPAELVAIVSRMARRDAKGQ